MQNVFIRGDDYEYRRIIKKRCVANYFAGLHAVEADTCIRKYMAVKENSLTIGGKTYDLGKYNNIYLTGFGKVSGFMAAAVEKLLGDKIKKGIVNVRYGYTTPCKICQT
ncbi:DUF4147 domain-containing protein [Candidatus Kuenenia stuttgartensis]|uniref:DUF4147 domain-containing protein n=1 Tax=Kuenenia stuttgartiensis TaxID=174633 RepID=UPI00146AD7A9|nr:DUF4147 domain-containing protein [Candidatus Kuenenia stuttgartiensis]